jgi:hypothetical protein
MARILIVLMLPVMFLISCDWIGGDSAVSWEDPAGDVRKRTFIAPKGAYKVKLPALDIVGAKAGANKGHVVLTTEVSGNLSDFFDYTDPGGLKHGGFLAEYFIDVDNNPDTGVTPTDHQRGGYDVGIRVMLGYKTNKGKVAGGGNVNTNSVQIISNYATFSPRAMNKDFKISAWLGTDKRTTLGKDSVEISIPYAWFGLESGDTVRLCFKEGYQSTALSFSEDRTLKLK